MSPAKTTSPRSLPAPSPALLGVLRELAPPSHTPVLPFLLPSNGAHPRGQDTSVSSSSTNTRSPPRMGIPEKYLPQPDGSWIPSDCWELHGQKWCETPSSTYSSRSDPSPILNVDGGTETAPTATTTSTHSPTLSSSSQTSPVVDVSSLPKGWQPKTPRTKLYPIPVIVTSSIFLAFAIVVIIWICSITRKQRRIRLKVLDTESRAKIKRTGSDDDDPDEKARNPSGSTTGFSNKQSKPRRLRFRGAWYRSRKVRRQRNVQPHTPQHDVAHSDADAVDHDDLRATASPNSYPSTLPTRSLSYNDPEQSGVPLAPDPTTNFSNTSLPRTVEPPRNPPLPSPPTYAFHQTGRMRNIPDSRDDDGDSLHALPPRHSDIYSGALSSGDSAAQHQHQQGHVATDDKEALARMAQMRSAPPQSPSLLSRSGAFPNNGEGSSSAAAMMMIAAAAPEWTDDLDFPSVVESESTYESSTDPHIPSSHDSNGRRRSPIEGDGYYHNAAGSATSSSTGKTLRDAYGAGRTTRANAEDVIPPDNNNSFDDDGILRFMTEEEGLPSPPPPWARHSSDDLLTPSISLPAPPPLHPSIAREHARLRQTIAVDIDQQNNAGEEREEETLHSILGLSTFHPHPSYTSSLSSSSSLHSLPSHDWHLFSISAPLPQYPHSSTNVDVDCRVGVDAPSAPPDEGPITVEGHLSAVPSAPPLEDDDNEVMSQHNRPSVPPLEEEE